jgi:hypothetical protein
MNLTEEDKTQYNLIEDKYNNRIIGRVEDILNYLDDMVKYNLNNTDDEDTIKQIKDVIYNIKYIIEDTIYNDTIIAIFENVMLGLDWQVVKYEYL